jgi:AcrR family transcriptional regulator
MPRKPATPPIQARSQETLTRIVSATEELLKTKAFERITIREIVRKADCPIASFYARFNSKDELLPELYDRYNERVKVSMFNKIRVIDPRTHRFDAAIAAGVDLIIESYTRDKWLMREVALFARRNPAAINKQSRRNRTEMHKQAAVLFAPYAKKIRHKDPVRAAEVGIFLVAAIAREAILFGSAPHAEATGLSQAALRHTLIHTFTSFLTRPCASPHLCCSSSSRRSRE